MHFRFLTWTCQKETSWLLQLTSISWPAGGKLEILWKCITDYLLATYRVLNVKSAKC